jgi:hypothetical protein
MRKMIALIALGAAVALPPAAALAEQGTSSSYGSVGAGPHIPTQSLTPFDRAWNHGHQSKYQAYDNEVASPTRKESVSVLTSRGFPSPSAQSARKSNS